MKAKCFSVEKIPYIDKKTGDSKTLYKVWFQLTNGIGFLTTDRPVSPGDEVVLEIYPLSSDDVRTNMRMAIRIAR